MMLKNQRENKFRFQHYFDTVIIFKCSLIFLVNCIARENPNMDLYFAQNLNVILVSVWSLKALNEFNSLVPDKIDRYHHDGLQILLQIR